MFRSGESFKGSRFKELNMDISQEYIDLQEALRQVREELDEANDIINAIRSGEVDALIVDGAEGHQIFTLKSADHTYRIFIEQMSESAITIDKSNRILYCNSQFAKLVDIPLEKVIGHSFISLLTLQDQIIAQEAIDKAWEIDTRIELRLENRLGNQIPVQLALKTLQLDEGVSLSIVLTDLTALKHSQSLLQLKNQQLEQARKVVEDLNDNLENTVKLRTAELESNIQAKTRIEEVLRSNQQRLTGILQTMGEGLCILDSVGQVTFANKKACEIFKLDEQTILSRDFYSLQEECFSLDGTKLTREQHPIAAIGAGATSVFDDEIRIINAAGDSLYISINASPLFEEDLFTGTVMTFTDVTGRRLIAVQKDDFISVASHELKTPLTSLKASMQMLSRVLAADPRSEKVPALAQKANVSLAKVVHLAEDLMNVSKIQHGPLPLNKEMVDIGDLMRTCGEEVFQGVPIQLIIEGDVHARILADKQRLEQVIVNLYNNILKYASASEEVKVNIAKSEQFLSVSVKDQGAGIPEAKLQHLFDRYYQVDPEGRQVSGLGLGLYISSEIIKRHGGVLSVESQIGHGSTFTFTLPC